MGVGGGGEQKGEGVGGACFRCFFFCFVFAVFCVFFALFFCVVYALFCLFFLYTFLHESTSTSLSGEPLLCDKRRDLRARELLRAELVGRVEQDLDLIPVRLVPIC